MRKLLVLLTIFLLTSGMLLAQKTISGKVTDEKGSPISNASVVVKGSSNGGFTNEEGSFRIEIPGTARVLVFSAVGYVQKEVAIDNKSNFDVVLAIADQNLEEVVVVGYSTQKRTEFTGSAATVKGDVVANRPIQSFGQGLTGQASGVNIIQSNGLLNNPPVIRVRGLSSISLSSFPLVVVDGIPISTNDVSANASANNPLADINPADIESIDILKDAASTSIYGSRGAAGVLLITTKRGKSGKVKVNYDGWVGNNRAARLPDVLNASQFVAHKNKAIDNAFEVNPAFTGAPRNAFVLMNDPNGNVVDVDFFDLVYRNALSHSHNLSVSGGNDKTTYYFSASYTDQDGFLEANNFSRRSGRFNISNQTTRWLKLFSNISYSNTINNAPNSGSYVGGAFATSGLGRIAMSQAPNVPVYTASGDYSTEANAIGRGANLISMQWSNPQTLIDLDKNRSETNRLFANIGAEIALFKGLSFKSSYTWDLRLTDNQRYWNPRQGDGYASSGNAYNNTNRSDNWVWTNTLQYKTSILNQHNINVLVGTDAQNTYVTDWGGNRTTLADPFFTQFQGVFLVNDAAGNGISEQSLQAYLASLSYNFSEKYYFAANIRRDGNSALAEGKKWGIFGGVSAGWAISNENFFKNSGLGRSIQNLRLKASWGKVGNGGLGNYYGAYDLYSASVYGTAPSVFYSQSGNKDLQWETSKQTNIGLDLGILNNRLNLEVNWFNKDIDNLILAVPQAPSRGVPGNSVLRNVGSMYNKGWEFSVNGRVIDKGDFRWNANINFATVKNKVTSLVDNNSQILGYTSSLELTSITKVGYAAANIYGVRTAGVNPANGRRIFIDNQGRQVQYQHLGGANAWTLLDGTPVSSGVVTSAAVPLGNTQPTWYGGFNNTLTYKQFDAGINFTFSGGNYIYNGTRAGLLDQRVWNNSVDILDAWSTTKTDAKIPRPIYGDNISNGSAFLISENVEKADFLRLNLLTLGYTLPTRVLGNSGISSVRVYVQGNNLMLLTNYSGVDPEISTNGNSNTTSGIERNSIPQGRGFTFGVNVGF